MNRKTIAIRQFVAVSLAVFAVLFVVGHCAGCRANDPSDEELAYRGALLRCVDKATTLAESKACRKEADRLFNVRQDGGS